ncbi:MAG: DJ-1/PfpI family protein [Pirellulales bacterium]
MAYCHVEESAGPCVEYVRNRSSKATHGIFLPEVATPYAEFNRAKYEIDFVSLTGKGWETMLKATKLSDADLGSYDAIFLPGGLAPMADMSEYPLLKQVIKETCEQGTVVRAVCH